MMVNLTGQRFGRLTVEARAANLGALTAWACRCDCGATKPFRGSDLKRGRAQSCGCLRREVSAEACRVHGMHRGPLYTRWQGMIQRCTNPNRRNWERYGGRGITVCDEWRAFEPFYRWSMANGFRPGLDLDRIDNDGGYSPSNCRYVTPAENAGNRAKRRWSKKP